MEMVKKFLDEKRGLSGRYGSAAQSTTEAVETSHVTQIAAQSAALGGLPVSPKLETGEADWDVSKTYNPLMLVRRRLSKPDTVASYRVPEPSPLREDVPVWCKDMTSSGKTPAARTATVTATAAATPVAPVPPTVGTAPIPAAVSMLPSGPTLPTASLAGPPTIPPGPVPTLPPQSPQGPLSPATVPPHVPAGLGLPTRPAHVPHVPTASPIPVPQTGHVSLRPTTPDVPVNPSEIEVSPGAGVGRGMRIHTSPISVPAPGYNPTGVPVATGTPPTGGPPKAPRVVLRIPNINRSTPHMPAGQPTATGVPNVGPPPGVARPNPTTPGGHVPIMVPKVPQVGIPMVPTNPTGPPGVRPIVVPGTVGLPGAIRSPPSGPVPPTRAVPPHPLPRGPLAFQPKVRVLSPGGAPPTAGVPTGPLAVPKGPGVAAPTGNLVVRLNPGAQPAAAQPKASLLGTLVNYCMKKFPTQVMQVREIAIKKELPEFQRVEMLRNMIQQLEPNAPILTMFTQAKK